MYKKEKGVTLLVLIITIIVLIIIAAVSINAGNETIKKAELENLKTNMLLIQAKTKEYVENTNFKIGKETDINKINEIKDSQLKGLPLPEFQPPQGLTLKEGEEPYSLSGEDMEKELGLTDLKNYADKYVVLYNIPAMSVDIIYMPGLKYEGNTYYTLSNIEEIKL